MRAPYSLGPAAYGRLNSESILAPQCIYAARLKGFSSVDAVSGAIGVTVAGTPSEGVGAYGPGIYIPSSTNNTVLLPLTVDSLIPTDRFSIAIIRQKTNSSPVISHFFGYDDGSSNRILAHCPWSDGNIYWDFGNSTGGSGRLGVGGQSWTDGIDKFIFIAGQGKGREVWRNGVKIGSDVNAKASRAGTAQQFCVGGTAPGLNTDDQTIYYVALFNDELSDAQCESWFADPDQLFKRNQNIIYFDSTPTAGATQTLTAPLVVNANQFFTHTINQSSPAQTLTAPLFVNANQFFAASIVAGTIELSAPFLINPNQFFAHSISQASSGQTLTAPLFVNGNQFFAHSISQSGAQQTLTASLFVNANTVPAHTLLQQQILSAGIHVNPNTFFAHTISQAGAQQTLTANLFVNSPVFFGHTINQSGGLQTLTAPLFVNTHQFFAHTISQPSTQSLSVPLFVNPSTFYQATISGGLQALSAPLPAYTVKMGNEYHHHFVKHIRPKTSAEIILVCFDFARFRPIDSIDSLSITVSKGVDPDSAQMLLAGPAIYQEKSVVQLIRNGVPGAEYIIKTIVTSGAEKFELACKLIIRNYQ